MGKAFADRIADRVTKCGAPLCPGFDPQLSAFPKFILDQAGAASSGGEELAYRAIRSFFEIYLDAVAEHAAAIKPNAAFFEQYGMGGMRALEFVLAATREREIPVILDCKRGDIGSTAEAYAAAYFGAAGAAARVPESFRADAITVNPYLGFDTIEPFVNAAERANGGVFVLVRTSNPGAGALQNCRSGESTAGEIVAQWVAENGARLMGDSGYSGLGAVVAATAPQDAVRLRKLMPSSLFLIPGFGAQGASAQDALTSLPAGRGGVINVSRGLTGGVEKAGSASELGDLIRERARAISAQLGGN